MRRLVAPVLALFVLIGVLVGFAVVASVGRGLSDFPDSPPWQAFALPGVLGILAAVLIGGTLSQSYRSRRR